MQVVAGPDSPTARHRPPVFVDEKVHRGSEEEVRNLIRSVSIAVFLRLRHELIRLQGIEYGDPQTLRQMFGKSLSDLEPQRHLIRLLSGVTLAPPPQSLSQDLSQDF